MHKEHTEQQREEFAAIFKEQWDFVLWKAKGYTKRDGHYHIFDAEDVASLTFASAFEEFKDFQGDAEIRTWLTTISKHVYLNWKRDEERLRRGGGAEEVSLDEIDYDGEDPGALGVEIQEALSDANWYQSGADPRKGRVFLLAKDFKQESPKEIKEICERVCTSEEIEILNLFNSGYSLFGISKLTSRTKKQVENIVNRIRSRVHKEISL